MCYAVSHVSSAQSTSRAVTVPTAHGPRATKGHSLGIGLGLLAENIERLQHIRRRPGLDKPEVIMVATAIINEPVELARNLIPHSGSSLRQGRESVY